MENVDIDKVVVENRMRRDLGDIEQLSKSISENGLIQPIVLTAGSDSEYHLNVLVAGHRRLEALKKLGVKELEHGVHFIWRSELSTDEYRRNAVELEENIRRKQMTWSEEEIGGTKMSSDSILGYVPGFLTAHRIITKNGCWLWTMYCMKHGYGQRWYKGKVYLVHRLVAWFMWGVPLDRTDISVRHTCDNPPCFNPDHLIPGTQGENVRDTRSKGRARGRYSFDRSYGRP